MNSIEPGVYNIPLTLSPSLEPRRPEFETTLIKSQQRLKSFAQKHGWSDLVAESFADRAWILDSKQGFDRAVIELLGLDPDFKLLPTACACLEERVLAAVSPEVYVQVYPQGVEEVFFEKVLTHEMAHRLHIRVLNGDEDRMGPIWFFEGFAVYAASQFERSTISLEPHQIRSIINSTERGSYADYGAVIRHLLARTSLTELVTRAGDPDFAAWTASIS